MCDCSSATTTPELLLLFLLLVAVSAGLQLMQAVASLSASQAMDTDSIQCILPDSQKLDRQQQQLPKEEPHNIVIARNFLASPQRTQMLRRISGASVQDLAGDTGQAALAACQFIIAGITVCSIC
jgi:hypothetical protein